MSISFRVAGAVGLALLDITHLMANMLQRSVSEMSLILKAPTSIEPHFVCSLVAILVVGMWVVSRRLDQEFSVNLVLTNVLKIAGFFVLQFHFNFLSLFVETVCICAFYQKSKKLSFQEIRNRTNRTDLKKKDARMNRNRNKKNLKIVSDPCDETGMKIPKKKRRDDVLQIAF
jgi:predicted membrane protein